MRQDINMDDAYVLIYDSSGKNSYALYNKRASDENNALDSYIIKGGESDPFEYIRLEIPRKKMKQVASDLMKPNAIVAGMNKIYVRGVGEGSYIVSASDLTGDTCTITGYCQAYKLTSTVLQTDMSGKPFDIIDEILTSGRYGSFITGNLKYWCIKPQLSTDTLNFAAGQTLWHVIQVCATYIGCRVFFTGIDSYLVDYRITLNKDQITWSQGIGNHAPTGLSCTSGTELNNDGSIKGYYPNAVADFGTIDIYTNDTTRPEYGRCVGQVKLGNEGVTTVINKVIVKCAGGVEAVAYDKEAQRKYNETESTKVEYTLNTILQSKSDAPMSTDPPLYYQGSVIASNIVDYRSESQQSVEFSMKEYQNIGGSNHWIPFFPPSSRINAIDDDVDDIHVSNTSVLNESLVKPQKLILSSYTRRFPEGVTTYKFGVIASVDLSSKISDMAAQQK